MSRKNLFKRKEVKPVSLRYDWEKKFKRTRCVLIVLLALAISISGYTYVQHKKQIKAQNEKIQRLYGHMIDITLNAINADEKTAEIEAGLKKLQSGHLVIPHKHGERMEHTLISN